MAVPDRSVPRRAAADRSAPDRSGFVREPSWPEGPPAWALRRADLGSGRSLQREPRFGPPRALFVWIPVFLSFVVQVPASILVSMHHPEFGAAGALMVLLAIVGPVALIFARRFPGPVVAITAAAACADLVFTPGSGAPYIALAFGIVSAMARGARIWAIISVGSGWVLALIGSVAFGVTWHPARVILTTAGVVIVLFIGESIRTRRDRVVAYQEAYRKRRDDVTQAERERIARELHDVLAHSLSQINVQAGVGLHLIDDHPEKAAEALASIKATSKTALDEVRGVLGFLRSESPRDPADSIAGASSDAALSGDASLSADPSLGAAAPLVPQADLTRLPALVDSVASDDLEVTLVNRLTTDPPPGVQLALYRITQESLTNVTRHAHARRVRVTIDERADDYQLSVIDDGTVGSAGDAARPRGYSTGNGVVGMTERAELLGGHLEAGPMATGGFAVVATVPRRRRSPTFGGRP
ncbi:sensor histidine kinase [Subtercola lobariae]|uniref:histidine kinase n=1 Tax=Subtercola lobariae TaxID=1588641 RepID=A0A917B7X4_9MICO|nr:sensor histidine kinase [Subtercola lobariae]GGF25353.1 two-component sensor histidine kinase [Subtercola lobariae]